MSHVAKSIRALISTMVVCLTAHEPATAADPVSVEVGIFVLDISELRDASQTFRTDFHLSARWNDAQLADPDADEIRRLPLTDVCHLQLDVGNRRDVEFLFPTEVEVDRLGNVYYRQRISGHLSPRLDLRCVLSPHGTNTLRRQYPDEASDAPRERHARAALVSRRGRASEWRTQYVGAPSSATPP